MAERQAIQARGRPLDWPSGASWLYGLAAALIALLVGAFAALSPLIALGSVASIVILLWLLALGHRASRVFLGALTVLLAGYVLLNKGFSYLGVPPIFVGEAVLFLAIPAALLNLRRSRITITHVLLVAFMVWGLVRTVPYVGIYGVDALRDAVTWGYAFFAIAVSLVVRRSHVRRVVAGYRRAIPFVIVWIPIAAAIAYGLGSNLPTVPLSNTPILVFKSGDAAVHLAAISAFILVGLYSTSTSVGNLREFFTWSAWAAGAAIISALNRAGMIAMLTSATALLFVRSSGRLLPIFLTVVALLASLTAINPVVDLGTARKVSFTQLAANITSIVSSTDDPNLEGSKAWREAWWNTIVGYTIDGPYFWTGKGYGINLADADGFQVAADHSLRAPHNGHLVILARSGVPGLVLWFLLQASYCITILRAAIATARAKRTFWTRVLAVIFAYWVAAMVNMSFDVYLEGPQGGIWFWSVFGFGLAVATLAPRTAGVPEPETAPAPASAVIRPGVARA